MLAREQHTRVTFKNDTSERQFDVEQTKKKKS